MVRNKDNSENLIFFLIIAIGFSWLLWIPRILIAYGIRLPNQLESFLQSPYNLAAMGPLIAAIIMSVKEKKLKILLQRAIKYQFPTKWYIIIFLLFPLISFISLFLLKIFGEYTFNWEIFTKPWMIIYFFFEILLLGGPLQEEFGWRGYVLDKLQRKFSAIKSSIIIGIIWLVWHFPLYLIPKSGEQYGQLISINVISMAMGSLITMILMSILFTWIYNNTGKSLFATLIFHTMLNLSVHKLFPVFANPESIPYFSLMLVITTVAAISIFGGKTLSKSRK